MISCVLHHLSVSYLDRYSFCMFFLISHIDIFFDTLDIFNPFFITVALA